MIGVRALTYLSLALVASCAALDGIEDPTDRSADASGNDASEGAPMDGDTSRADTGVTETGVDGAAVESSTTVDSGDADMDGTVCTPVAPITVDCADNTLSTFTSPAQYCVYESFGSGTVGSTPSACQCDETYTCECLIEQGIPCAPCTGGGANPITCNL